MLARNGITTITLLIALVITTACAQPIVMFGPTPTLPATLQMADLAGTWQAKYTEEVHGLETLVLKADGTYQQRFEDSEQGYSYTSPWNKWYIERLPDGRVYVHLEGMRYFPGGIQLAESGEPLYLYDDDIKEYMKVEGEVILRLYARPASPKGLELVHLADHSDKLTGPVFRLVNSK